MNCNSKLCVFHLIILPVCCDSFFAWKSTSQVELGHPFLPMVCGLCARLHGGQPVHRRLVLGGAGVVTSGVVW